MEAGPTTGTPPGMRPYDRAARRRLAAGCCKHRGQPPSPSKQAAAGWTAPNRRPGWAAGLDRYGRPGWVLPGRTA
jgi:hypothetical protein